jgi:hypothetical protein
LVGAAGATASAASISSPIDHTCLAMPSAIAGVADRYRQAHRPGGERQGLRRGPRHGGLIRAGVTTGAGERHGFDIAGSNPEHHDPS